MTPVPLRSTRLLLASVVLLLASACGNGTPSLQPLPADARVLAFGNSLTHGTGAGNGESYPEVLAELIGREVIAAGVPGEETAEGRERLPGLLDEVEPDLLILVHGGNDVLRDRDPASIRENLAAMVAMARERGTAVVLVGVPERSLFASVAGFYEEVAEDYDVPLEDGVIRRILRDNDLTSDPIHPNAAGYRVMAEAIHELLVDAGAVVEQ